ncbi:MAG: hypothetical protein WEB55_00395, partial [Acidimicrobiia bacterium]
QGGPRDDILNQLWFHFNTFQGPVVEQEALDTLLLRLSWDGTAKSVSVPFARGDGDETAQERAILRLHQVGAIRDYLKDWGAKAFTIHLAEATLEDLDSSFIRFVMRTQPGRVEERRAVITALPRQTHTERAATLASTALKMVYDSVEKSRRRALREMRLLAAEGTSSHTIQQRIEDYFREGELAPVLEQLVESGAPNFDSWFEVYRIQSRSEEGELRGTTARLLESYPDHPGLLLGRALAELMTASNQFEFRDNLTRAFAEGRQRYDMTSTEADSVLQFALDTTEIYARPWRPVVWLAWEEVWGLGDSAAIERRALQSPDTTAGELVLILERRLGQLVKTGRDLVQHGGEQ